MEEDVELLLLLLLLLLELCSVLLTSEIESLKAESASGESVRWPLLPEAVEVMIVGW